MNLQILPGIVWALDEVALQHVRRWQAGLPAKVQTVFRVASCWEEFVDLMDAYRRQNFDDAMLAAGLSLETQRQGRRINTVIVACWPQHGGLAWAEAEEKIANLMQLPLTLEQHRVLLNPALHPLEESLVPDAPEVNEIAPLRFLPWLLTRQVTGGFTLSEAECQDHFSSLLDALFLAEREGGRAPGHLVGLFYQQPAQPGHVRLAGFSRIPLDALLQEMARSLAQGMLLQGARQPYDAVLVRDFEQKLARWLDEFQAGQRTNLQVEALVMQELRKKPWPAAALFKELPPILAKETMRLQRQTTVDPPRCNIFMRTWQRLRTWCGCPPPDTEIGPDSLQTESLVKNLNQMQAVLEELNKSARQDEELPANLPPELVKAWSDTLVKLIVRRLEQRWSELDVVRRLAWQIEQDMARHFVAALRHWDIPNESVREVARAWAEGNLLRFSAPLRGGLPIGVQALVTSLTMEETIRHGAHDVPSATLRLLPGRPPLLLAVSEPVPVEHVLL